MAAASTANYSRLFKPIFVLLLRQYIIQILGTTFPRFLCKLRTDWTPRKKGGRKLEGERFELANISKIDDSGSGKFPSWVSIRSEYHLPSLKMPNRPCDIHSWARGGHQMPKGS